MHTQFITKNHGGSSLSPTSKFFRFVVLMCICDFFVVIVMISLFQFGISFCLTVPFVSFGLLSKYCDLTNCTQVVLSVSGHDCAGGHGVFFNILFNAVLLYLFIGEHIQRELYKKQC